MSTATPHEPRSKSSDPTTRLRRRTAVDELAQTGITPTSTENAALQILALRPEVEQGLINDQAKQAVKARLFGEALAPSMIGRFKVIRELGRGGTGIVYIAYDIELDRKIAVKLLNNERPDEATGSANARLLREAQAMARVSHPNIAAVHEVGMFRGQIYVAMEFVNGQTLGAWLHGPSGLKGAHRAGRTGHRWQDILAVFRQAAAGLAAAHDAGLVHRDFKPANAILGEDDRLRVLDFGLARADATPGGIASLDRTDEGNNLTPSPATSLEESRLDLSLTLTGTVLGTPAYMSPEQFLGQRIDAKSDQFSFCVALYEALYGERPFDGDTLSSLMTAVLAGKVRDTPTSARAPRWLRAAVLRGLRNDPEQRWPSMHALAKALTPERQATGGSMLAALGLGVFLTAGATSWLGAGDPAAQVCSGAAEQLTGVWDDARREQVGRAMLASGAPGVETTLPRAIERLDAYADEWIAAHHDACEATNVRKEQSIELMDQRMTCLAERRSALAAAVNLLSGADKQIAEHAVDAANDLPDVARCNDPTFVGDQLRPPGDPHVVERVRGAKAILDEARVRESVGKSATGLDLVQQAADSVKGIDWPPLAAEIALLRGTLLEANSQYPKARDALEEAYFTALAVGHTRVALDAAIALVLVTGRRLGAPDVMQTWGRHADALAVRAGDDLQRARLATHRGLGAFLVREYGNERERMARAREFFNSALPIFAANDKQLDIGRIQLAIGETYSGDPATLAEAERYYHESIASYTKAACDEHPGVALGHNSLAHVYRSQNRLDEAQAELETAGELIVATLGKDHRNYGLNLAGRGAVQMTRKNWSAAEPLLRQSLEILLEREGPLHVNTVGVRQELGYVLLQQGKFSESMLVLEAILTDYENHPEAEPYYIGKAALDLHTAAVGLHRGPEVASRIQAAYDRLSATKPPDDVDPGLILAVANIRYDLDQDLAAARPLAERARANALAMHYDPEHMRTFDEWLTKHPAPK
jgi:tetratricopeptide (TPR) repeat protein